MSFNIFMFLLIVFVIVIFFIFFYKHYMKFYFLESYYRSQIKKIPKHIGIIADGNGRWAKEKGHARTYGHSIGSERFDAIIKESVKLEVEILTFFLFSTENWKRPKSEINYIFRLLDEKLTRISSRNDQEENIYSKVLVYFVGNRTRLPLHIISKMENIENQNKLKTDAKIKVVFAIDYGGHEEIITAIKDMITDVNPIKVEDITKNSLDNYMDLDKDIWPDPDLIIRTSGECRLSGFMTWHTAYSELYFTSTYWPNFSVNDFLKAILWYSSRKRRFGNVK
jgi:undecaprenyl diphosphate synthase